MESLFELSGRTEIKLLVSIMILLLLHFIRVYLRRKINKKVNSLKRRLLLRQTINYVFIAIASVLLIIIWRRHFTSMVTILSFVGAALTIVSKELILNLLANSVIIWRGLFDIGDRIHIGEFAGDVIATGPVFFTIAEIGNWVKSDEHTARTIKVPNSLVLTLPLANYSKGLSVIWNDVSVDISIDSNWKKAKEILMNIANEVSYKFNDVELYEIRSKTEEVMFNNTEPFVRMRIKDGKVKLEMRYACKFYKRSLTEDKIWEMIIEQFEIADDIKIV